MIIETTLAVVCAAMSTLVLYAILCLAFPTRGSAFMPEHGDFARAMLCAVAVSAFLEALIQATHDAALPAPWAIGLCVGAFAIVAMTDIRSREIPNSAVIVISSVALLQIMMDKNHAAILVASSVGVAVSLTFMSFVSLTGGWRFQIADWKLALATSAVLGGILGLGALILSMVIAHGAFSVRARRSRLPVHGGLPFAPLLASAVLVLAVGVASWPGGWALALRPAP